MKLDPFVAQVVSLSLLLTCGQTSLADTNAPPDFQEVRQIIRANLPGVTDAELDRGALHGLLLSVRGKVSLVESHTNIAPAETLSQASSIGEGIAYLRISSVDEGLSTQITAAVEAMSRSNKLTGLIFDLRFSGGGNYSAAVAVADIFLTEEKPLLDDGAGMMKSSTKTNALTLPVALLVNGETVGAAEALAEVMRATGTGLILGGTTRGAAMTSREFTLSNGRKLRIADASVKLADGSAMSSKGVSPDIAVDVSVADERHYLSDPFVTLTKTSVIAAAHHASTNKVPKRVRLTEADLVRARREGIRLDEDSSPQREVEPELPVIQDPVLARAVDLLKGLAVVRRNRS